MGAEASRSTEDKAKLPEDQVTWSPQLTNHPSRHQRQRGAYEETSASVVSGGGAAKSLLQFFMGSSCSSSSSWSWLSRLRRVQVAMQAVARPLAKFLGTSTWYGVNNSHAVAIDFA